VPVPGQRNATVVCARVMTSFYPGAAPRS
jgi:hypothetical protein